MEWGGAQLEGAQFTQGMIHNMEYTGVMLRDLLAEAGVQPEGKWVYVEGADASSNGRSIPLEKALDGRDGRLLREWRGPAHGTRIPCPAGGSGLGRQHVDQVASPDCRL
jgi:DMSO/TMAO reductase YedYZ molybdopterin-dependent catalytic subunit